MYSATVCKISASLTLIGFIYFITHGKRAYYQINKDKHSVHLVDKKQADVVMTIEEARDAIYNYGLKGRIVDIERIN